VLASHAAESWMRGVRVKPTQSDDPRKASRNLPGSMDDPAWRRGFELLAQYNFVCDVQVPFWTLDQIADLASDHPGTPIGINHSALPADRSPEGLAAWRRALESVASKPNVHLKVSGIGVPPGAWPVEQNLQIVREAIEIMGWRRCMFASNFPVDGLCASYDTIYSTFKRAVANRPHNEIKALFHDNARNLYRIPTG
jgi:predicted TIM-barrel fold metal-dependent hydrolase